MLNQIVIVGRLEGLGDIKTGRNGKYCRVMLACPRTFKNANGEYETDYVKVTLRGGVAESTKEYCRKGDIIGIKGRIESTKNGNTKLVAEKVSFLSSKKESE
jgi:single-strand DNA-binding protein